MMNVDEIYKAMMGRLTRIESTDGKPENTRWSNEINRWGLEYEVASSSGLSVQDCRELSDEDFLLHVDCGMLDWDI